MQLPPANAYYRKSWFLFLRQRKPAPPPCISSPRYPGRAPSGLSYSACSSRDWRPACLPRLEWSLQGAHVHVEPTPSPRQVHVQATDELRNAAWCCPRRQQPRRLGGWAAGMLARATGTESEILHAGMRTPPRTHIRLGQAAKKSGTSMFSGPRASLLAGIELTSSDVRRVWLPLLRGFRTSASGRTTDGWLDVWCLPGDLYRHASGGAEKTRIVVRVDAVKRDGIVRRSGHLVHTRLVLSLVQFKVLTHIGITSWRRRHRCETAYAASSCQGDAYCIMCLKHHLSTKVLFHNSPYAA